MPGYMAQHKRRNSRNSWWKQYNVKLIIIYMNYPVKNNNSLEAKSWQQLLKPTQELDDWCLERWRIGKEVRDKKLRPSSDGN